MLLRTVYSLRVGVASLGEDVLVSKLERVDRQDQG